MIFLQGSPVLKEQNGVKLGRPFWVLLHIMCQSICLKTDCQVGKLIVLTIGKLKLNAIVEETVSENMTIISGIPSWVQMYFENW